MRGFHDGVPIVYAKDVGASLAFYRDPRGFEETYLNPPGADEPELGSLRLDAATKLALAWRAAPRDLPGLEPGAYVPDPDGNPVAIGVRE